MKTLLTLIAVLFVGCGDSQKTLELEAENKRLEAEVEEAKRKVAAEEKNKKLKDDLLRASVVGSYVCVQVFQNPPKFELKLNGDFEGGVGLNLNGKPMVEMCKWSIGSKKVVIHFDRGDEFFEISSNGDLIQREDIGGGLEGIVRFKKSNNPK